MGNASFDARLPNEEEGGAAVIGKKCRAVSRRRRGETQIWHTKKKSPGVFLSGDTLRIPGSMIEKKTVYYFCSARQTLTCISHVGSEKKEEWFV